MALRSTPPSDDPGGPPPADGPNPRARLAVLLLVTLLIALAFALSR